MLKEENKYNAFISYSHENDAVFAKSLQQAIENFTRNKKEDRAIRIFRDESTLSVNSDLWNSIRDAILNSQFFILIALIQAAKSKWVKKELETFCAKNGASNVLVVLINGEIIWDSVNECMNWSRTTSIPNINTAFLKEPFYLDAMSIPSKEYLNIRNLGFLSLVASLSSTILNIPKDQLVGIHLENRIRVIGSNILNIRFRTILGFSLASLIPFLGLNFGVNEQLVALLGMPLIGAVGSIASGLSQKKILGFTLGYTIIIPFYLYGTVQPVNWDIFDLSQFFIANVIGFILSGKVISLFFEPIYSKRIFLYYSIGGIIISFLWLIFRGLRPEDNSFGHDIYGHFVQDPILVFQSILEMYGFWWREPLLYLPLIIVNIIISVGLSNVFVKSYLATVE